MTIKTKVGQLTLFEPRLLAGWHRHGSYTWRWIFYIRRHFRPCRLGPYWQRTHGGEGIFAGLNTPWVDVCFQAQPNVWERIAYQGQEST